MKRTIDVLLGDGRQVGTLRYDLQGRRENAAFEYGAGWLGEPEYAWPNCRCIGNFVCR